jgi:hypothetical protein
MGYKRVISSAATDSLHVAENCSMTRILILSLVLAGACLLNGRTAQAISRNNPYRSFNLSGYNYGSTQWEMRHGRKANSSWSHGRSGKRFVRNR